MLHWLMKLLRVLVPALLVLVWAVALLWLLDGWGFHVGVTLDEVLRLFRGH